MLHRSIALLACIYLILLLVPSLLTHGESRTLIGTITCVVPAGLEVGFDQGPIALTIDPDTAPTDQILRLVSVGTNAPPVAFGISLLHHSPSFSYRLTEQGIAPGAWKAIPVLPGVSSESLPALAWTDYALDLRGTAGPDLPAGSYQDDIQLRFQISGIIHTFFLHVETLVLPRSPVVDAGPDQTVNEGDTVVFSGTFNDPDIGETYAIAWNFDDGTTASGTLTPTHAYSDNGTYRAALTVTDSGGRDGQDALTVVVNDLGPTAHVRSVPPGIPPLTVEVGEEATFDASDSTSGPDPIVSYEWDWDYVGLVFKPSGNAGETVTHAFEEAGTYTIAVLVADDDGSTDIATLEVVVSPVTTAEASLATPEVAGAGGAAVSEVAIDEVYVHQQALAVSQFHLLSAEAPETPSNPVIHFPFDEGGGELTYDAIDSRLGRDPILEGTLYQVEWIEGAMGPENQFALSLGEDGYMKLPPDPRMSFSWNQDFTLELWVRTTGSAAECPLVRRQRRDSGSLYGLSLFKGVPVFYASTAVDNYAIVKGLENIADEVWHHIACMREKGTLKLYVDGGLVDELAPETRVAGAGGGNLGSDEPAYFGGLEEKGGSLGGLVDASYRIGETIQFRMRIADETGAPVAGFAPSLLFIRYDCGGQKVSSGFVARLNYSPNREEYAYSLDTSAYEEGIYDFFLVPDDGSQQRLRIMLLEIE